MVLAGDVLTAEGARLVARSLSDSCRAIDAETLSAGKSGRNDSSRGRFSSSGEVERIGQPDSPHRHDMRTIRRVNRRNPERPIAQLLSNPPPREKPLFIFGQAVSGSERTAGFGMRIRITG
jgi:hypothetical protein